MNTIFVYGLLKPGLRLHHVVAPYVVRSAPATVRGRLYDAGVPAARFDEDDEIDGVVLWLDEPLLDEALAVLDDVEDEGEMYARITIEATTDGGPVAAQAYHYLRPIDGLEAVGRAWQKD